MKKDTELDHGLIEQREALARGAFGNIIKARYMGRRIVIKHDTNEAPGSTHREHETLTTIPEHPNIIELIGWYQHPEINLFGMVLEYSELGSLDIYFKRYQKARLPIPLQKSIRFVTQVTAALAHLLDTLNLLHLDIKPANVLLFHGGAAKLCDFGNARKKGSWLQQAFGSPLYMDPAQPTIAHKQHLTQEKIAFKAEATFDIYSIAILLCSCALGSKPYSKETLKLSVGDFMLGLIQNTIAKPKLDKTPESLATLIKACWRPDRTTRPTMQQVHDELLTIQPTLPQLIP